MSVLILLFIGYLTGTSNGMPSKLVLTSITTGKVFMHGLMESNREIKWHPFPLQFFETCAPMLAMGSYMGARTPPIGRRKIVAS